MCEYGDKNNGDDDADADMPTTTMTTDYNNVRHLASHHHHTTHGIALSNQISDTHIRILFLSTDIL